MSRLDQEIERLLAMLAQAGVRPTWHWIALVEAADVQYAGSAGQTLRIPRQALRRQGVYSSRFDEHLRAGYSWINFSAAGIAEGALVVVVEIPRTASGAPIDRVSVNLSGSARNRVELFDARLDAAAVDGIVRACAELRAGKIDPTALGQRLVQLTSAPGTPAWVYRDAAEWRRQLEAAWQWAQSGDERGLGRAEGIAIALRGWAESLTPPAAKSADEPAE
ncbi:MAG TPA: hypothetical protein VFB80_18735 [Pirellulaceae bacterium]|nr:hypothetical protein [Pirellulaceae bacterium]